MRVPLYTSLILLACACASQPASAESLRCNGSSARVGDSKASVLYKCGKPTVSDELCATVLLIGPANPRWPFEHFGYECVPVEEWIYDRGEGNLVATVSFREGKIHSIRYGRVPS